MAQYDVLSIEQKVLRYQAALRESNHGEELMRVKQGATGTLLIFHLVLQMISRELYGGGLPMHRSVIMSLLTDSMHC